MQPFGNSLPEHSPPPQTRQPELVCLGSAAWALTKPGGRVVHAALDASIRGQVARGPDPDGGLDAVRVRRDEVHLKLHELRAEGLVIVSRPPVLRAKEDRAGSGDAGAWGRALGACLAHGIRREPRGAAGGKARTLDRRLVRTHRPHRKIVAARTRAAAQMSAQWQSAADRRPGTHYGTAPRLANRGCELELPGGPLGPLGGAARALRRGMRSPSIAK